MIIEHPRGYPAGAPRAVARHSSAMVDEERDLWHGKYISHNCGGGIDPRKDTKNMQNHEDGTCDICQPGIVQVAPELGLLRQPRPADRHRHLTTLERNNENAGRSIIIAAAHIETVQRTILRSCPGLDLFWQPISTWKSNCRQVKRISSAVEVAPGMAQMFGETLPKRRHGTWPPSAGPACCLPAPDGHDSQCFAELTRRLPQPTRMLSGDVADHCHKRVCRAASSPR